jgi:hypothetical protein
MVRRVPNSFTTPAALDFIKLPEFVLEVCVNDAALALLDEVHQFAKHGLLLHRISWLTRGAAH